MTLPACNISVEENASCPKPLHLKFELLYAAFLAPPADVKIDLMNEVHKLIPEDPQYSVVATQNLVVEKAGSGIHAYYPVSCYYSVVNMNAGWVGLVC